MIKIYHQHVYRTAEEEPQVDFTPMLDVIFILLIFNVLLIGGQHFYELQVTLPKVHNEKQYTAQQQKQEVLQLHADDSYSLNGLKINTLDEVKAIIKDYKQNSITLACDDKVQVANLLAVLKLLQDAGIATTDVLLK